MESKTKNSREALNPLHACTLKQGETLSRIAVYVRVRPTVPHLDHTPGSIVSVEKEEKKILIKGRPFQFTDVFDSEASQKEVYDKVSKEYVDRVFQGYYGTIIAYGQTGTGKTYTISSRIPGEEGLLVRCSNHIFSKIKHDKDHQYVVTVSFIQLYNESLQDLLNTGNKELYIREDSEQGVFVSGLTVKVITSPVEMLTLFDECNTRRVTGYTECNAASSRSHLCVFITLYKRSKQTDASSTQRLIVKGRLTLVDLSGSERLKKSGAEGIRKQETQSINLSLSCLGNVIHSLSDPKSTHVPYRDSKLTRLLQDSLGGDAYTSIIITVGPCPANLSETVSALLFGQRAMLVVQSACIHTELDYKSMALKLQQQLDEAENRIRDLEKKGKLLENAQQELEKVNLLKNNLKAEFDSLTEKYKKDVEYLNKALQGKGADSTLIQKLKEDNVRELHDQRAVYDIEITNLKAKYASDLNATAARYEEEIEKLCETLSTERSERQYREVELEREVRSLQERMQLAMTCDQLECRVRSLQHQLAQLQNEKNRKLEENQTQTNTSFDYSIAVEKQPEPEAASEDVDEIIREQLSLHEECYHSMTNIHGRDENCTPMRYLEKTLDLNESISLSPDMRQPDDAEANKSISLSPECSSIPLQQEAARSRLEHSAEYYSAPQRVSVIPGSAVKVLQFTNIASPVHSGTPMLCDATAEANLEDTHLEVDISGAFPLSMNSFTQLTSLIEDFDHIHSEFVQTFKNKLEDYFTIDPRIESEELTPNPYRIVRSVFGGTIELMQSHNKTETTSKSLEKIIKKLKSTLTFTTVSCHTKSSDIHDESNKENTTEKKGKRLKFNLFGRKDKPLKQMNHPEYSFSHSAALNESNITLPEDSPIKQQSSLASVLLKQRDSVLAEVNMQRSQFVVTHRQNQFLLKFVLLMCDSVLHYFLEYGKAKIEQVSEVLVLSKEVSSNVCELAKIIEGQQHELMSDKKVKQSTRLNFEVNATFAVTKRR